MQNNAVFRLKDGVVVSVQIVLSAGLSARSIEAVISR
jgi:hypothetical protein